MRTPVWTKLFILLFFLSLSLYLVTEDRLGCTSPSHSPSAFPFLRVHVFFSLSLSLYSKPAIPSSFLLSRLLVRSSSNLRLLSRSRSALPLPLFFSIVHSPAPLALQTLLADEARFVLNFLNFTFRGPSRSSPPFFHGSFISIRPSFHPYRDRSNKRHKRIVNGRIERTMPRALVKRELSVIFLARATS